MPEASAPQNPIRPKLFKSKTLHNTVLATKFHYLEFETTEPFVFTAGQYVNAIVADHTFRAYSVATKTSDNRFGLLVDCRPGGPGSQFFEGLTEGKEMQFMGPIGVFTVHEDDGTDNVLLLGTGSGMSPLRCIVDDQFLNKNTSRNVYLYFGLTKVEEIFWKEYFEELESKYPNFHYRLAILDPDDTWTGHKGYNTDLMVQDFPDASNCGAYLCGHPAMIEGATKILLDKGCLPEHIHKEKFFLQ